MWFFKNILYVIQTKILKMHNMIKTNVCMEIHNMKMKMQHIYIDILLLYLLNNSLLNNLSDLYFKLD